MQSDGRQMYGHYVMIPCAKAAGKEEKLQAVEKGLLRLLEGLRAPWLVPDFGAMEFLIREGTHSTKDLSWQIDEPDDLEEVISVAIRYKSEKGE